MATMLRTSQLICFTAAALLAATPAWPQTAQERAALDALAVYQQKLAEYERIHGAYLREHEAYWDSVSDKRKIRNAKRRKHETIALTDYVLAQPPVYSGPRRPVSPLPPPPPPPVPPRPEIPVAADFLAAAKAQWGFVPDQPRNESDFKRAYAKAARAAGLTQAQIVGVYAFETGGRGSYDTQAGLEPPGPGKRAISPAMGYNQLLSTNTVALFAENGHRMLAVLERKARTLGGAARQHFEYKLAALKRMIAYCRSLPHSWREYDKIAKTTEKGWGIHAAVLDIDVGPLLQVQKLLDSLQFARMKRYDKPLTAAELELMNLTGDGNGIDMVMMPQSFRERVPTANFFQPRGYARNPVARRTKVVAGLIAEIQQHMDRNAAKPGARELAAAY
jgi:type II secretory pathway pseudopilin PulG